MEIPILTVLWVDLTNFEMRRILTPFIVTFEVSEAGALIAVFINPIFVTLALTFCFPSLNSLLLPAWTSGLQALLRHWKMQLFCTQAEPI